MTDKTSPQWYLEVEGTKVGPYSLEQLFALANSSKISAAQRVTSDAIGNRWVPVGDLLRGMAQTREHFPPPRPQDIPSASGHAPPDEAGADPTRQLFETLQVARDRKAGQAPAAGGATSANWRTHTPGEKRIPDQVWLVAALALLLGASVWGLIKLVSTTAPTGNVGTQRPPISPITPVTPPITAAPARPRPPMTLSPPTTAARRIFVPPPTVPPPRYERRDEPPRPRDDFRGDQVPPQDPRDARDPRDLPDPRDIRDPRDEPHQDRRDEPPPVPPGGSDAAPESGNPTIRPENPNPEPTFTADPASGDARSNY